MGNCTEDDGQGSEDWDSTLDWNWDLDQGIGVVWKPDNEKPENGRPEKPDNSTARPEFPEKPADCKCPRLPLKNRQIKTGIKYEYSQNDGELTMST